MSRTKTDPVEVAKMLVRARDELADARRSLEWAQRRLDGCEQRYERASEEASRVALSLSETRLVIVRDSNHGSLKATAVRYYVGEDGTHSVSLGEAEVAA